MLLLYFMDGLKHEMMEKYMPFLSSINTSRLMSDFGYSCACHATMYTSRYIEEHNTWFVWKKGDNSPYKFIDKIPFLKYLNFMPVKMVLSRIARKLKRNSSFSGIPMLVNLPLKYWSLFEPCEIKFWTDDDYMPKYDTLFKIIKREGIKSRIVGLSRGGDVFGEEAEVDYKNDEFVYYFIGDVDSYMHQNGENSQISIDYLKKADKFIKETYEKAKKYHDDVTIMCYSDHGHIDVDKKIDINEYFKSEGLNVNKYIHLIESTFARFWVRNEQERNDITRVLNKMEKRGLGFIMTKEHFDEYHLNFDSNEHGDIIFHLNAPNIFTKTIWGFGKTIKSMHGYLPTLEKHIGIFATNKKLKEKEYVYLTDILPSVLTALHINCEGRGFHGENIVGE